MSTFIQRCVDCGHTLGPVAFDTSCPDCGGLLDIAHNPPPSSGLHLRSVWDARLHLYAGQASSSEASGVWRFHEVVLPSIPADRISFPEGNTPLLQRSGISDWAGVQNLSIKHEGYNPSGSFKDRGMTVAITQAVRVGARAVICASTGNTSSSLAQYAAQAGLPAIVLIPDNKVSPDKLAQTQAYGAQVVKVRGDFDACVRLVREVSTDQKWYLVNSVNPFRIEGQKTIILELLQQRGWKVPDWIAVPAGNLGNTAAFGKALRELKQWGVIDRIPRLIAVQAAGAAPFVASYKSGFKERYKVQAETRASAIRIGDPVSYHRAVQAIQETNGLVLSLSDEDLLEAKAVIDRNGIGCELASAASVAAIRALRKTNVIAESDDAVAVLTGHLLKDSATVQQAHELITIDTDEGVSTIAKRIDRTFERLNHSFLR